MKRFLLLLALPLLCVLAVQASDYGINVGGVEVSTSNYNNVTGKDINSGASVRYDPSSKTLTVSGLNMTRTGGGNYAIHNRSVSGLTIKFTGSNYCSTVGAGLRLMENTDIIVDGTNSYASFTCTGTSDNQNGVNISSGKTVNISGTGTIYFVANGSNCKEGMKGGGSSTKVNLKSSVTVVVQSTSNYAISSMTMCSYDGSKLIVPGNGSYQSLYQCYWSSYNKAAVLAPVGAYYSSGTIYTSSGSAVKSQEIQIHSDYAFIINSSNFPDAKLREYLLTLYSKGYVTSSEVNSRTSLTFSGKQVSSITGIHRFTALTYLDCSTNYLTSLSTLPSNLKTLDCHSNNLSSLPTLPTALETLNCGFNQLTSLPTLPSTIKQLKIRSNKFTSLTITGKTNLTFIDVDNNEDLTSLDCHGNALTKLVISGCLKLATLNCSSNAISEMDGLINRSALTYLDVSNNRYLTELICYNNGLTTLNVSGCSAMTELYCYSNKLGNLGTLPSAIKTLNCKNNKLTSLPTLPTALEKLDCSSNQLVSLPTLPSSIQRIEAFSNKFTSLTITSRSALTYLDVHNNTSLTSLVCSGNSLTRLDVTLCPAMTTLGCSNNKLTDLGTLPTALTYLDCSKNQLTSLSTLPSTLKQLYCHNNQLTWLPTLPSAIQGVWAYNNKFTTLTVNGKSALTALDVSINPNLTTLECYSNALTELSVENCPAMTSLDCHSNKVTSLNLAASSNLKTLRCYRNELTSLGVSGKTKLELINCSYNKLTSLNVSNCNSLSSIQFNNNQISGNGMTTLVNSLRTIPDGSVAYIYIYNEGDSDEGNAITDDQLATVFDKNWIPYKYTNHWEQIEKPEPPASLLGDVNGDGKVNGDDLNTLINILLGKDHDDHGGRDNVDGEGGVDGNDLNMLINILLGKVVIPEPLTEETFTVNGVSFKMMPVEGGTFTMGATPEQGSDASSNENPTHQVTLSNFSIGQTEVTQALWQAVMGSNPSRFTGDLQRPVEYVTWNQCQTFITKLNQLTGHNFRLPTEAEWEFAARGGNQSRGYKYSGSNTVGDVAWYWDNIPSQSSGTAGYGTQTVATKAPNDLGLYDMSGNVWEW
ncbi:MAG: leucine-rich repeat domain-containing protein, partial [Muribaculaceae bacterium]|nr:leucine-rich repeat domain-containing protein [Muribaculaceae bacterium]